MANILITNILDELREENKRLSNENKVIFDLLDKYRNCLINVWKKCKCIHIINNKILIESLESLESLYKRSIDQKLQETNETNDNVINVEILSQNQIKSEELTEDSINDLFDVTFTKQTNNLNNNKKTFNKSVNKIKVIETNISEKIKTIEQKTNSKDCEFIDNLGEELDSNSTDFFKSQKCDQLFGSNFELKDHCLTHPEVCGQTSSTGVDSLNKCVSRSGRTQPKYAISLSLSGQTYSTPHKFVCLYTGCDKSYLSSKNLKLHIWSKHTNHKPFKCEECTKSFVTNNYLQLHRKVHSKEDNSCKKKVNFNIGCEFAGCHKYFATKEDLARHIKRNHTTEKRFECKECFRKYLTQIQLRDHQKIHSKQDRYRCSVCNQSYDNIFHLKKHETLVHSSDGVIYKCNDCPFETKFEPFLRGHSTKYHTDIELTVECDNEGCSKMFKTIENMTKHRKQVHFGKTFACDWPGCDFVAHLFRRLNVHKRVHNSLKELKCDFEGCSKVFKLAGNLWQHRMTHLKKYVCSWPECGQRFSEKHSLTAHTNTHLNVRPFKCYIEGCVKDFTIERLLKQHLRTVHNIFKAK